MTLGRSVADGSQNQQRDPPIHGIHVLRTVTQTVRFSLLAVGVAIVLYFLIKPYAGMETVSWMCILGAAPFAAMGFITYHGMTAEQFLIAWLRSELIEPREIRFESNNYYYDAMRDLIYAHEKEVYKAHDEIDQ